MGADVQLNTNEEPPFLNKGGINIPSWTAK